MLSQQSYVFLFIFSLFSPFCVPMISVLLNERHIILHFFRDVWFKKQRARYDTTDKCVMGKKTHAVPVIMHTLRVKYILILFKYEVSL